MERSRSLKNQSIKLNVPLFRQKKKNDCGVTVTKMILDYYGVSIPYVELLKKIPLYPNYGSHQSEENIVLMENGIDVEEWIYDYWLLDNKIKTFDLEYLRKLKSKIKNSKSQGKKDILFEIDKNIKLLEHSGKIIFGAVSLTMINNSLKAGNPVVVTVFSGLIYRNYSNSNFHALVVYGKRGFDYLVRDPANEVQKVNENELLAAIFRANGYVKFFNKD